MPEAETDASAPVKLILFSDREHVSSKDFTRIDEDQSSLPMLYWQTGEYSCPLSDTTQDNFNYGFDLLSFRQFLRGELTRRQESSARGTASRSG